MDKGHLTIIGILISAIGAAMLFGTWMEIRYQGPVYESLNGIDVLSVGTNPMIVLCIPLIVSMIFLLMIVLYFRARKGIRHCAIIACIAIIFITGIYTFAVSGHFEGEYSDEFHIPGYASHLSFLISLINIPVAFLLEGKIISASSEPIAASFDSAEPREEPLQQTAENTSIRFCPECGSRLSDSDHQSGVCTHCGMRF